MAFSWRLLILVAIASLHGSAVADPPRLSKEPLPGLVPAPRRLPGVGRWQLIGKTPTWSPCAVAWSPDGQCIARSDGSRIRICNARNFETQRVLVGHSRPLTSIDWSRSRNQIASSSSDGTVRIWSADGVPQSVLFGHRGDVNAVAWSPDAGRLASAGNDGTIRVWKANGRQERVINVSDGTAVNCVAWSPDGKRLAAGDDDCRVTLWTADGVPSAVCRGHLGRVTSVAWEPEGKRFASCTLGCRSESDESDDVDIRIWNADGSLAAQTSDESPNFALQWDPNGNRFAVINRRGELRCIQPDGTQEAKHLGAYDGNLLDEPALAWNPSGSEIAIGGARALTVLVPTDDPNVIQSRSSTSSLARAQDANSGVLAISADGKRVVMRTFGPTIARALWNLADGSRTLLPEAIPSVCLEDQSFSRDGAEIVFIDHDSRVAIWTPARNSQRIVAKCPKTIRHVAWSPAADQIAYCDEEQTIRVVELTGRQILEWTPGQEPRSKLGENLRLRTFQWSADGRAVIAGGRISAQALLLNGTIAAAVEFGDRAAWFSVSSNFQRVLADLGRPEHPALKLWQVKGFSATQEPSVAELPEGTFAFDVRGDDATVLLGRDTGAAEVWLLDRQTASVGLPRAHSKGPVTAVAFAADGRRFATGGWDGVIKIWRSDGTLERSLYQQSDPIRRLHWSRDGKSLIAVTRLSTVLRWSIDEGRCMAQLMPTESGEIVQIAEEGRIVAVDPQSAARDFFVIVEKPSGAMEMVDAPRFLAHHGLLQARP